MARFEVSRVNSDDRHFHVFSGQKGLEDSFSIFKYRFCGDLYPLCYARLTSDGSELLVKIGDGVFAEITSFRLDEKISFGQVDIKASEFAKAINDHHGKVIIAYDHQEETMLREMEMLAASAPVTSQKKNNTL